MPASVESLELGGQLERRTAVGEDLRELVDVARGEVLGCLPVALAQARDDLGAQQVDLAVQDAALEGDLALALAELVDALAQLVVGELRGVVGLIARRQQVVVGQDGELLRELGEQLVRDDGGVDLARRRRAP